jgi:hypothetical protein
MKRHNAGKVLTQKKKPVACYLVTQRLDESLPLHTQDWSKVEQLLMQLTEFAPNELIAELVDSLATWGDDQARRGYILGQEDLVCEMKQRSAA